MPDNQFTPPDSWRIRYSDRHPSRPAGRTDIEVLDLPDVATRYAREAFPDGIFEHQCDSVAAFLRGEDVCLATGTASGKTLAFHLAAMSKLASDPSATVLAVYPMRALAKEQEERWRSMLSTAGLDVGVARIDGQIKTRDRPALVAGARVLLTTPDILHAWALPNLGNPRFRKWFKNLRLVILDEVHVYTGVMGSNSAFLFRRLEHCVRKMGGSFQLFAASATLSRPDEHLRNLTGRSVTLFGPETDSSPQQEIQLHLLESDNPDSLAALVLLLRAVLDSGRRFIAFVDSRKQTEMIASILLRELTGTSLDEDGPAVTLDDSPVLPYRSGYEGHDRDRIQTRLADGSLQGVVSTSALELGLDIKGLDTAVLVGVPQTSTSFRQRIGRVGRAAPGTVLVVNSGSVLDVTVFGSPEDYLERPPAEGALYLENPRIQYIHALCLARQGGEHDVVCDDEGRFLSPVEWPEGFEELCQMERVGQMPSDLQPMKVEGGETPHWTFPLRDVEKQFTVEFRQGPNQKGLGSLSFSQVMRETYPGAIYYYATQSFRVTEVSHYYRKVTVRREKKYTSRPVSIPAQVYPNLIGGQVFEGWACDPDLLVVETDLQIREAVAGWKEWRGAHEFAASYPPDLESGIRFQQSRFARNYFTTGVTLFHPIIDTLGAAASDLARILFEGLLMVIPFDRQDIGYADDRLRTTALGLEEGRRFIAVHDRTYGSLRLSARLLDRPELLRVLKAGLDAVPAIDLAEDRVAPVSGALETLIDAVEDGDPSGLVRPVPGHTEGHVASEKVRVIRPPSRGWNRKRGNAEVEILRVFYSPRLGVAYAIQSDIPGQEHTVPAEAIVPVTGECVMAWFDPDTGALSEE